MDSPPATHTQSEILIEIVKSKTICAVTVSKDLLYGKTMTAFLFFCRLKVTAQIIFDLTPHNVLWLTILHDHDESNTHTFL